MSLFILFFLIGFLVGVTLIYNINQPPEYDVFVDAIDQYLDESFMIDDSERSRIVHGWRTRILFNKLIDKL